MATAPGMMSFFRFVFSSIPDFYTKGAIVSATNLPAAHDVKTDKPSVLRTSSHDGTRLFSTSPETIKYVSEKLLVISTGELSVGLLIGYTPCLVVMGR